MAENEPAITPARAPVCEAFISIIYRQVKKIPVPSGRLVAGVSRLETSAVLLKSQSRAHIASSKLTGNCFGSVSSVISRLWGQEPASGVVPQHPTSIKSTPVSEEIGERLIKDAKMRGPSDKHGLDSRIGGRALEGRAILVTRARAQSEEITAGIEALGGTVIHCPTIEFAAPSDPAPLDAAIDRLEGFDWIVFASANAVTFFCDRLNQVREDGVDSIQSLVTCVVGPATAKALTSAGIEADVIPEIATSEGALSAIIEYAGGSEALAGVRFLIPRARVAREVLPTELVKLGAVVEAVEAYQTIRPTIDTEKIITLLEKGSVDAITFTSPSTISNFAVLVGSQDLSKLLGNCLVACIGPVTTATALQYGLHNPIEPEVHTSASLIEVIASSLSAKPRR